MSEFSDVFESEGILPVMVGDAMKIQLKEEAISYAVNGLRDSNSNSGMK